MASRVQERLTQLTQQGVRDLIGSCSDELGLEKALMWQLGVQRSRVCEGLSRRSLLQVGACSALGLHWGNWLQTQAAAAEAAATSVRTGTERVAGASHPVKSVMLLWLWGGPSHLEMWDPKPLAPLKIRGCFTPIATSTPGTQISELLPLSAARSHQYAIIRSMAHDMKDHNQGGTVALTGSTNGSQASGGVPFPGRVRPSMGSLVSYLMRHRAGDWPAFTTIGPNCKVSGADLRGQLAGSLGVAHDPFRIDSFSFEAGFKMPPSIEPIAEVSPTRMTDRRSLLAGLDRVQRLVESSAVERFSDLKRQAFGLLTSADAKRALQVDQETVRTREQYGYTVFGQNCLLGRRLVEAGVPFVQINWSGDAEDEQQGGDGGWDLHYRLFERMQDRYCPIFDRAFTALLDDLQQRGLLDSTLVIAMGEFGRSPEISGIGGREHWPFGYSIVVAGGGTPGGAVIGASTPDGGYPASRPIHPVDLHLTVLEKMGLDKLELFSKGAELLGNPISELG